MQSQNPLFYGVQQATSLAYSARLCVGVVWASAKLFLHVIDPGSLRSPRQIHAVPQVQTRTSGVSGEMDEILQIAHDMILNK